MRRFILVLLALCLLITARIHPFAKAQIGSPALPVANVRTDHPRILLTPTYIEQTLRPRMDVGTENWRTFYAYVTGTQPENEVSAHPIEVTRSLAVAYLMTGERRFADRAMVGVLQMVDYLRTHPSMLQTDAIWDDTFLDYTAGLAVAYDWLYPALSTTDRAALADVMIRATAILNDPQKDDERLYYPIDDSSFRFNSFDHWGARAIWANAAVGFALLSEHPDAPDRIDYARALLTGWMIPSLETYSGGSSAEGMTFGYRAAWANVQAATAFWTAMGENYFEDTGWWYDRMAYDLFLRYPAIQRVGNQPDGMPFWGYPSIIGDSERYSETALLGRSQDMLLSTVFAGTDHAAWMNWFLGQGTPTDGIPTLQGWMAVDEFLWRDTSILGFPPPWKLWFTAGTGQVFLNSGWEGLSDGSQVYVSFNAGDHFALHQFFDQGNLTVARGGDALLVRSGVYSGDTDHDANYYGRTIAANTLLICDLAEDFDGIRLNTDRDVWLNDCGQRPTLLPSAVNPFFLGDNRASYETGTIQRFAEEGSLHYFRADITAAYNNTAYVSTGNRPKISEAVREFVYIRPGYLVIHDRVLPTDPNAGVMELFHTQTEPQQDGNWLKVTQGNSVMYMGQFAPQVAYQIDEGYNVAGETIDPAFNPYENTPYGVYHIRYTANQSDERRYFLTVLAVDDERFSLAPPDANYIDGDGTYGVLVNDWQIMFDDDPGDITSTAFPVGTAPNLLITGLEPLAAYRVTLPNGTNENMLADDGGTLYIFVGGSGEMWLRKR